MCAVYIDYCSIGEYPKVAVLQRCPQHIALLKYLKAKYVYIKNNDMAWFMISKKKKKKSFLLFYHLLELKRPSNLFDGASPSFRRRSDRLHLLRLSLQSRPLPELQPQQRVPVVLPAPVPAGAAQPRSRDGGGHRAPGQKRPPAWR